ncbi:glucose-6-phosphate isomerase, partial [Vibrio parahaemolyticus]
MLKNINPTQTQAWKALTAHFESAQDMDLKELFAQDAARFDKYSARFGSDILVDYSKNLINEETLKHLFALANETELKSAIEAMFSGEAINQTEGRAVLHTALRNRTNTPVMVDGEDVM